MRKGYTTETRMINNPIYISVSNYKSLNKLVNSHRYTKPEKKYNRIGFWHVKLKSNK